MGIPPFTLEDFTVYPVLCYCPNTSQSRGKYEVMTGTYKNAAEMVDLYGDLISRFPSIIALIDPFRKEVTGSASNFIPTQSKLILLDRSFAILQSGRGAELFQHIGGKAGTEQTHSRNTVTQECSSPQQETS